MHIVVSTAQHISLWQMHHDTLWNFKIAMDNISFTYDLPKKKKKTKTWSLSVAKLPDVTPWLFNIAMENHHAINR